MEFEFVKCHGSGNDFVMTDAVSRRMDSVDLPALAAAVCDRSGALGADGLLLAVRDGRGFGMRMFNPDGSEAEMCGNGIRCVARLVRRYTESERFMLTSGGRSYAVAHEPDIAAGVQTYGVRIPVSTYSPDFGMFGDGEKFIAQPLPPLDSDLRFTALSLGNPHIVAECARVDLGLLERLGARAAELKDIFPKGVNVSLYEVRGAGEIFVATCERGAGITLSCGTAMTACSTAAVLTGAVDGERTLRVRNRGGMVQCRCTTEPTLATELRGNATFLYAGVWRDGEVEVRRSFDAERESYERFAEREKSE